MIVIVSGFFNPLHGGHMDLLESAAFLGDRLIVIVNNDKQQLIKKGEIILDEYTRCRIISSLDIVDEAVIAVDQEPPVTETLRQLATIYHGEELVFANGGDRSIPESVPEAEVCKELGIKMVYGVGGTEKADSSTRINAATGMNYARVPGETMTVGELVNELHDYTEEYGPDFLQWNVYTEQCSEGDKYYKRTKQNWEVFSSPNYPDDPNELWWEYFAVAGFIGIDKNDRRITINVNY